LDYAAGVTRIAIAIVVGCLAIAAALYLGLRERGAAPPPVHAPAPPDRDVIHALEMQAAGQLEATRAQMVEACWTGPRTPSRYDVELAIDARGHEVGRSLSEVRDEPSRADVATCVRKLRTHAISVAPPGSPVTLTIPLVLP
jgi:hypothetical protein